MRSGVRVLIIVVIIVYVVPFLLISSMLKPQSTQSIVTDNTPSLIAYNDSMSSNTSTTATSPINSSISMCINSMPNSTHVKLLANNSPLNNRFARKRPLIIGIASVRRGAVGHSRSTLLHVVRFLIQKVRPEDQSLFRIIIFNLQTLPVLHDHVEPVLHEFKELFDSGFLELVNKTDGYGKLLENLKKRYGDSAARVLWRSKESLDFAFLADYAHHYGDYFLFLEDDVVPATNFIPRIFETLQQPLLANASSNWLMLSLYSPLTKNATTGYPFDCCTQALVFKSVDIPPLVDFVRAHYNEMPVDWILNRYVTKTKKVVYYAIPNLFQHMNGTSTLREKREATHFSPTFEEPNFVVP